MKNPALFSLPNGRLAALLQKIHFQEANPCPNAQEFATFRAKPGKIF
jgi:hypothetical protein